MKLNSLKQTKGFTLVEILIVVIIVGLLAGIAVSKLGDSKERAVASVKKSAAAELNKAIQTAYVKGNIIDAAGITAVLAGTNGTDDVILLTQNTNISSQFTASSLAELRTNIADVTPNSGSVSVTGADNKGLEVLYTAGAPVAATP